MDCVKLRLILSNFYYLIFLKIHHHAIHLNLANFLYKDKSYDFMVYEKNESLPLDEGYGIQISTNSIKILKEINFSKINNENMYKPKGVDIYNIQKPF